MGDDQMGRWAQSENLLKWINKVSEEALDVKTLAAAREPEIRAIATCIARYRELLHEHNSLDFSSIQYEALQLLEGHPEVLAQLRERLSYLMVDEYQDTNTIQERILLLLAGEKKNLCVVGDDDPGALPLSRGDHPQHSGVPGAVRHWPVQTGQADRQLPLASGHHPLLQRVDE
jgi:DNA helicase-2/ATP-dependent DNA helicase PcrA